MPFKKTFSLFTSAFHRYQEADAHDLGAALAYFTIFSLVPLFSIIVLITGFFLSQDQVTNQILDTLGSSIGANATDFLRGMISNASAAVPGVFATLLGFIVLLYSVIGVTSQLQGSLDKVLGVGQRKTGFLKGLWIQVSSFSIILLVSLVLIIFLTISAGFSFFAVYINRIFPFPLIYLQLSNFAISFLLVFTIAVIVFRYLPLAKFRWKSVITGALTTSFLFVIGRFIISLYVTFSKPASAYGAAGALIVILLWIYYSSQIFFFGASVVYAHAQRYIVKRDK